MLEIVRIPGLDKSERPAGSQQVGGDKELPAPKSPAELSENLNTRVKTLDIQTIPNAELRNKVLVLQHEMITLLESLPTAESVEKLKKVNVSQAQDLPDKIIATFNEKKGKLVSILKPYLGQAAGPRHNVLFQLPKKDLLAGKYLKWIDLSYLTMKSEQGEPLDFSRANLRRSQLVRTEIERANLTQANISRGNWIETNARQATMSGLIACEGNFYQAYLDDVDARPSGDIPAADFGWSYVVETKFRRARLQKTDFRGIRYMYKTDFSNAELQGARLPQGDQTDFGRHAIWTNTMNDPKLNENKGFDDW